MSDVTNVWAHRGCTEPAETAPQGFTENTLEAFAEARRRGADGVELDVRLTADGGLAVHHDAEVPGLGPICELGVADLPAHVPLLADALGASEGMLVNVEIKNAPQDPGWDEGEAVAALDGGGDRGGGLDRPGARLVLPAGDTAGRAGRRRAPGPRRAVGLGGRARRRRWPRPPTRASAPCTPS